MATVILTKFAFGHAIFAERGRAAALKALRVGDTLVVWKLDWFGRDRRHLVNLVGASLPDRSA